MNRRHLRSAEQIADTGNRTNGGYVMKVGVLSDTHDLLRPETMEHLKGCEMILHGGDISSRGILDLLDQIAPVKAVRGNKDVKWAENLPDSEDFELCGQRIYMTHKKKDLPKDLEPYDLVIVGHTHQYAHAWITHSSGKMTLILNPGSCGPRRFYQPVTMALLEISPSGIEVQRIDIPNQEAIPKAEMGDLRRQIETVIRLTDKGKTPAEIADKHRLNPSLVEQIARLYVTHPGVTVDGIMDKMGV